MTRFLKLEYCMSRIHRPSEYFCRRREGSFRTRSFQITRSSLCSPHLSTLSTSGRSTPASASCSGGVHLRQLVRLVQSIDHIMALMKQGRVSGFLYIAVLVIVASTFLEATLAVQYMVGGVVAKWSFLQANANLTFYNDWAKNITFKTGDSLLFEYDNATHSVLQLATEAEFVACILPTTPVGKWFTGRDSVFISKAGTYYFICGTPFNCNQGMKLSISATGEFVAAPPPPAASAPNPAPNASHATSTSIFSGVISLLVLALSALISR